MQLFSVDHLYPTNPSLRVSRMGYVLHFLLSDLSTSLHHTAECLKIPALGISHLFHESLGLIPKTLPILLFKCCGL